MASATNTAAMRPPPARRQRFTWGGRLLLLHLTAPIAAGGLADEWNATFIDIDPNLAPLKLTNDGRILFVGQDANDVTHGVLWTNGVSVRIGPPTAQVTPAEINEFGVVAGGFWENGVLHAFRWRDGVFDDLHPAGHPDIHSQAFGLNSRGDVCGRGPVIFRESAAVWYGNVMVPLAWPFEGANDSIAHAINGDGTVVGAANIGPFGLTAACMWYGGNIYSLPTPTDPPTSHALFLTDTDIVVGSVAQWRPGNQSAAWHVALWEPDASGFFQLHVLGGADSEAFGVNRLGEVVGRALYPGVGFRATLWRNGTQLNLGDAVQSLPGFHLTRAVDINDHGQILCHGETDDGNLRATVVLGPADADGDGLLDVWEYPDGGIDSDGNGTIDLNLYARGARWDHKDLFVEADAMAGRMPTQHTLDRVVQAFAAAPVANPDGSTGITLHIQRDETDLPLADWPTNWWAAFDTIKAVEFGTHAERNDPNSAATLAAKRRAYRYCIFANSYANDGSSGLAELPGNDFMVTLGAFTPAGGSADDQAGTFMHEFGHTLGLLHGGGDSINYKPNFYSVMNYAWQLPRDYNRPWWTLDYSRQRLPRLDESALFEPLGLGALPNTYLGKRVPHGTARQPGDPAQYATVPLAGGQPADWNGNGTIDAAPLAMDLNYWGPGSTASLGEMLYGWNDWESLIYAIRGSGNFIDGVHAADTAHTELTAADAAVLATLPLRLTGDANGDGVVDFFDIDPFLLALFDAAQYALDYPHCDPANVDVNGDGVLDFFDIDPFLDVLFSL